MVDWSSTVWYILFDMFLICNKSISFDIKIKRKHLSFCLLTVFLIIFFICIILYIFYQFFSFSYHFFFVFISCVILFFSKEIYVYKTSLPSALHPWRCHNGKTNEDNKITSRLSLSAGSSRGWKTRRLNSPGKPRAWEEATTPEEPRASEQAILRRANLGPRRGWRIAGGIGGPVMILRPR